MHSLGNDFRYALRQLRRSPLFTLTAALTLAAGIGANTAIFSLLYQTLLRALPVQNPEQLVELRFAGSAPGHTHSDGGDSPAAKAYFSYPIYRDLRDRCAAFDGLIAFSSAEVGLSWNNHADLLPVQIVSGNYFNVLGVKPELGRVLMPEDDTVKDRNPVAVLSYAYWAAHFGSDQRVLNKTVEINGAPFTVVGVAAQGFSSVIWGTAPDVFVPMSMKRTITPAWDDLEDRRAQWLNIIGRLKPSESRVHAEASANAIWYAIRSEEFKQLKGQSPRAREAFLGKTRLMLFDGMRGFSPLRTQLQTPMLIIMGMVVLVLVMACVNTASLLLVRAAGRIQEFAMRFALGASRGRVLRQLFLEGIVLGMMGAVLGALLAPQALKALTAWLASSGAGAPFYTSLDGTILAFTLGTTFLVSIVFSLAPAVQLAKADAMETTRRHGSTMGAGSLSFRRSCVALQIGLSLLLLIGAGLFVRTIRNLRTMDTGLEIANLVTFSVNPAFSGYGKGEVAAVRQRLLDSLAALPGVRSVAATSDPELADDTTSGDIVIPGYNAKEDEDMDVELPYVTAGYFSTVGTTLVAGREFTIADSATGHKVAVVNELFARRFFGSAQAALGRYVGRRDQDPSQIVGVVRNARHATPRDPVTPTVARPASQIGDAAGAPTKFAFYLRTSMQPEAALNSIRARIYRTDRKLVVDSLRSMSAQLDETLSSERVIALLAAAFGGLATVLAAIGLYGVLAYVTTQRTREIGIRMALGAEPLRVARLVLREVIVLAAVSLVFAIPAALLLGRLLQSQLFNVSSADSLTYASAIAMITCVALLAAAVPAYRAATVDPMQTLRAE